MTENSSYFELNFDGGASKDMEKLRKVRVGYKEDQMTMTEIFYPLKRALWFTGALPNVKEEDEILDGSPESRRRWFHCRRLLTWHTVAFVTQHFYICHFAFRCLFNFRQEDFWATNVELLRAMASIFNAHMCLANRTTLHKLLRLFDEDNPRRLLDRSFLTVVENVEGPSNISMGRQNTDLSSMSWEFLEVRRDPTEKRRIYKYVRCTVAGTIIYISMRVGLDWIKVMSESRLVAYVNTYFYRADIPPDHPAFFAFLGALDATLSRIVLSGCVISCMSTFISLSNLLGMRYKFLNEQIGRAVRTGQPISASDTLTLRSRMAHLSEVTNLTDSFFRPMTFVWFAGFLSGFCAEIAFFFGEIGTDKEKKEKKDLLGKVQFFLDTAYLIFWFSHLYFFPARLYSYGAASVRSLQHLSCWKPPSDVNFAIQSKLLLSQVQIVRPTLTAWNFFIINRTSMINIITALVTYVVVVVQLHPDAVKTLMKGSVNATRPHQDH